MNIQALATHLCSNNHPLRVHLCKGQSQIRIQKVGKLYCNLNRR